MENKKTKKFKFGTAIEIILYLLMVLQILYVFLGNITHEHDFTGKTIYALATQGSA